MGVKTESAGAEHWKSKIISSFVWSETSRKPCRFACWCSLSPPGATHPRRRKASGVQGTTGTKQLLPLEQSHFWQRTTEYSSKPSHALISMPKHNVLLFFFFNRKFGSWDFLLAPRQAGRVKLTWPVLRGSYLVAVSCTRGQFAGIKCKSSWLSREHAALAEVCGELDSSVLASEVSFTEGEVCKASRVMGSLNLTRRTTLAAWKLSQCEVHSRTFFPSWTTPICTHRAAQKLCKPHYWSTNSYREPCRWLF